MVLLKMKCGTINHSKCLFVSKEGDAGHRVELEWHSVLQTPTTKLDVKFRQVHNI